MKNDIWATLYYKLSTDGKPQHEKCQPDKGSCCSWQKAKATNSLNSYEHKPALSDEVYEVINPVCEELSSDDLLTQCISFTQNSNESFNSTV